MHRTESEPQTACSEFVASQFFVMRTPALAWDELLQFNEGAHGAELETFRLLRERLAALFERPQVKEAVYVASPGLYDRLGVWQRNPDSDHGQRLELTLWRYVLRMATRATPFGLFSGVGSGAMSRETRLEVPPLSQQTRRSRIDNDVLFEVAGSLARDPAQRQSLPFRPNSSLYRVAGRLRYAEARRGAAGREYHLVSVEPSPHLDASLERAGDGARLEELAAALVHEDPEISKEEAVEFVSALAEAQLLVPDLGVRVTGNEPIDAFLEQLAEAELKGVYERMTQVKAALGALDASGPAVAIASYAAIGEALSGLAVPIDPSKLVQVDLLRPVGGNRLGHAVAKEVLIAVELLRRMTPRGADPLADWKAAFRERYEQRSVPLAEVLDEETGIGCSGRSHVNRDTPLLAGLPFPSERGTNSVEWSARDRWLLGKVIQAASTGEQEIILGETDVKALAASAPARLPDAWSTLVRVAAASSEAVDKGEFSVLVQAASGPSGAQMLGRFCHASADIERQVRQHLEAEAEHRPDAIFAEIAHLSEGRVGNIACRPVLRDYEIVFLGQSGAPPGRQIPFTDLDVQLVGDRVVLRSRRLGREIVPRLTSAHNVTGGLGPYRFLCMLQGQGANSVFWSWGGLLAAAFLPRVRAGRAVLCRAQWLITQSEIQPLQKALRSGSRAGCHAAVQGLRARRKLPRMVVIADGDNELTIDLDNALCSMVFADTLSGRREAVIVEQFPAPEQLCVRGPGGRFTHELVLSFARKQGAAPIVRSAAEAAPAGATLAAVPRAVIAAPHLAPDARSLTLGSGCLYLKLYAGPTTAERLLTEVVTPLASAAIASGDAVYWFFVRYSDPQHHLRVRFFGEPLRLAASLLPAIEGAVHPLRREGAVWRMQLDTYERELERYGGPAGIELVERIFWIDSEATLELLGGAEEGLPDEVRWLVAMRGADQLLSDLGLPERRRLDLYARIQEALDQEHGTGTEFHKQLGIRYRSRQADIERLLASSGPGNIRLENEMLERAVGVLMQRSVRLAPLVEELQAREAAGSLVPGLDIIRWSLVHMHLNRLLKSAQRSQELVLCSYLRRYYAGLLARREQVGRRAEPAP
jgi:thiopeptide-type bacteriocin biosynthesis protein